MMALQWRGFIMQVVLSARLAAFLGSQGTVAQYLFYFGIGLRLRAPICIIEMLLRLLVPILH
jgi:hypothetical protein